MVLRAFDKVENSRRFLVLFWVNVCSEWGHHGGVD